jgi:hypothetical protein
MMVLHMRGYNKFEKPAPRRRRFFNNRLIEGAQPLTEETMLQIEDVQRKISELDERVNALRGHL